MPSDQVDTPAVQSEPLQVPDHVLQLNAATQRLGSAIAKQIGSMSEQGVPLDMTATIVQLRILLNEMRALAHLLIEAGVIREDVYCQRAARHLGDMAATVELEVAHASRLHVINQRAPS